MEHASKDAMPLLAPLRGAVSDPLSGKSKKIFGIGERITQCAKRLVCSQCWHKGGRMTPIPKLDPKAEKRTRQTGN